MLQSFKHWHLAPDMCNVHLVGGQFLLDSGGVDMFLWQWMMLSFSFLICIGEGVPVREKILDMNIKTSVFFVVMNYTVYTMAYCVITLKSNLIVPNWCRSHVEKLPSITLYLLFLLLPLLLLLLLPNLLIIIIIVYSISVAIPIFYVSFYSLLTLN